MASLAHCLKKLGIDQSHEAAILRGRVKSLRRDGYDAHAAAEQAVRDVISQLEGERADILSQVQAYVEANKPTAVDVAAQQAATGDNAMPEPTEAQKKAGNYKKGHVRLAGMDVAIENPAGSKRRPEWPAITAHYGYVKRTEAADGDHLDVFIKPGTLEDYDGPVFVVDQVNQQEKFDEHKVMVGWPDEAAARAAYIEQYTKGWKGLGAITGMEMAQFKEWAAGDTTMPLAPDMRKKEALRREVSKSRTGRNAGTDGALATRLQNPDVRAELERMAQHAGWAEKGGRLMRDPKTEQVTGRTKWVPKETWWAERGVNLNEAQTRTAVRKALAGESLSGRERHLVEFMLKIAEDVVQQYDVAGSTLEAQGADTTALRADDPFEIAVDLDDAGLDLTSDNIIDHALVTAAMQIDPSAVEAISDSLEPEAFMARIQEIIRGAESQPTPQEGSEADAGTPQVLEAYSQGDLEAREQAVDAAAARRRAEDESAERKAQADRERNDFTLTGSTRAADANLGQADLLSDATRSPAVIEDVGERLEGARKFQEFALSKEFSDEALAVEPFSKVWPANEIDKIEDKFAAAVAHAARAEVPAKPRVAYKLKRWVEKVKTVRSLAQMIVSGKVTREKMLEKMGEYRLKDFGSKVKLLEAIDREQWGRIGAVAEHPEAYAYEDGKQVLRPQARVEIDGRSHWLEGDGRIENHLDRINELLGTAVAEKRMQFEVRGREGAFSINKKGDKEYRKLMTFATTKEAFDYIKDNYADLVVAWDGVKERDNVREQDVRSAENRPRAGADYRKGKDVTAEKFADSFGFRGVQFGNWVAQGSEKQARQGMLNQAYDALMDLASIVNVPPKAISLNGTLGLAFGARGSGWASAHYEPDTLVINLTKTRGAGTLAHEWLHALDNYFSHQRGGPVPFERGMSQQAYRQANYITYRPEPLYVRKDGRVGSLTKARLERAREHSPKNPYYLEENWHPDPKHPQGVRPEVERRFAELVEALDASPMAKRARAIDKNENGYWSQIIERAARSFENYIIAKMMERGFHNDYLANVTAVENFARSRDRYPYLLPEEVAPVAEAFDNLFATVQTKETEKGTAMFRRAAAQRGMDKTQVVPLVGWMGKKVNVVQSEAELPAGLLREIGDRGASGDVAGAYWNGEVYLVADMLPDEGAVIRTALHEGTHLGLHGMFGSNIDPLMVDIYLSNPQVRKAADALKERYGHSISKATEEALADIGGQNIPASLMDRIVAFVRGLVRRMFPSIAFNDGEVRALVQRALAFSKRGGKSDALARTPDRGESQSRLARVERALSDDTRFARASAAPAAKQQTQPQFYKTRAARVIDRIDAALDPIGDLPNKKEFMKRRLLALGKIAEADQMAGSMRKAFLEASEPDRQAVFDYLTTANATGTGIGDAKIRQVAAQVKGQINRVGDMLVDRGLLSAEARAAHANAYLPRLYLKHLLSEGDFKAMGAGRKPSDLGYLKKRKDIPEEIRKVILGEIEEPGFLSAVAIAKPMRDMAILDWLQDIAGNTDWVLPASVVEWDGKRVSAQWLKSEAERLRKQARHYKDAEARRANRLADRMDQAADDALGQITGDFEDYSQLPNTARYGRLRGLWVRKEIFDDIMGVSALQSPSAGFFQSLFGYGGVGTHITQLWKMGKVALNPPSHVRNMLSNAVMLQLSGVSLPMVPKRLYDAAMQIVNNGPAYQIAKKYGLTESSFSAQELFRAKRELLDLQAHLKALGPMGQIRRIGAIISDFAGDTYQFEDALFKVAKILDEVGKGTDEATAAIEAQKWMFDYSLVPNWVRYARNAPIGAPFITYAYKVLPRLLEVAALHPQRFLPWVGLFYGLQYAVTSMWDVDDDDLERMKMALPKWLQDRGHTAVLPYKDEDGRWQVVDLGYFFPWTMYTESLGQLAKGEVQESVQTLGLVGGPIADLLIAWKTGRDPFTERAIVNPGDPPHKQAVAIMSYLWDMAMPPFVSSRGLLSPMGLIDPAYGGKVVQATMGVTDKHGEQKATLTQAMLAAGGVNLYAMRPETTRLSNIQRQKYEMDQVEVRLKGLLRDRSITPERRKQIVAEYRDEMRRRKKKLMEYMADSAIHPNLATQD